MSVTLYRSEVIDDSEKEKEEEERKRGREERIRTRERYCTESMFWMLKNVALFKQTVMSFSLELSENGEIKL